MKTKKIFYLLIAASMLFTYSCMDNSKKMTEDKNKETAKKIMDLWMSNQMDTMAQYVTTDIVEHTPDPNSKATGWEGMKETAKSMQTAFPDAKLNDVQIWADNDVVIVHSRVTGTNSGPMGGMPASNKSFDARGVDIFKFNKDGKATDHWGYFEEMKMMTQLGMMPAGGAASMAADSTKKM